MYNLDNYLAQVVETFFVCLQIAFCSFVGQSPHFVDRVIYSSCPIYSFTLMLSFLICHIYKKIKNNLVKLLSNLSHIKENIFFKSNLCLILSCVKIYLTLLPRAASNKSVKKKYYNCWPKFRIVRIMKDIFSRLNRIFFVIYNELLKSKLSFKINLYQNDFDKYAIYFRIFF